MKVKELIECLKRFDGDRVIGFAIDPDTEFEIASIYPGSSDERPLRLWIDLMPAKKEPK